MRFSTLKIIAWESDRTFAFHAQASETTIASCQTPFFFGLCPLQNRRGSRHKSNEQHTTGTIEFIQTRKSSSWLFILDHGTTRDHQIRFVCDGRHLCEGFFCSSRESHYAHSPGCFFCPDHQSTYECTCPSEKVMETSPSTPSSKKVCSIQITRWGVPSWPRRARGEWFKTQTSSSR